jgi:hypothetical protein
MKREKAIRKGCKTGRLEDWKTGRLEGWKGWK